MNENLKNKGGDAGYPVPVFGKDFLGNLPVTASLSFSDLPLGQTPVREDQAGTSTEISAGTVSNPGPTI